MHTVPERARIASAWLLSFRRGTWEFSEYPMRMRASRGEDPATAWVASVLNWPILSGVGQTRGEAREDLRQAFEVTKLRLLAAGETLPRPGTFVPLRGYLAPSNRVYADPELFDEFAEKILGIQVIFASDETSLFTYGDAEAVDRFRALIRGRYAVETEDLEEALLADILERIRAARDA